MDDTGCAASQVTVARYDDDYPLLYGEPARQPHRKPAARNCVHLAQDPAPMDAATAQRPASCRACGRCKG